MLRSIIAFVIGFVVASAGAAVGSYFVVTGGIVPAAADGKPLPLERWAARTSVRATLRRDAPIGANPVPLNNTNLIAGIALYRDHCAICHGTAEGSASASAVAKGEYPMPPQLASEGVEDDPEGWDVWKIENGIRWTGMPAWKGTSHGATSLDHRPVSEAHEQIAAGRGSGVAGSA
jgi:thiosulfate dehydrogenase